MFGRHATTWGTLLAGVLVGVACGDEEGDEPPLDLPAGVEVFVEFPRYLHDQRRLEVAVDNRSATELRVIEIALRSPLFAEVAPDDPDTVVEVERRRDLQIGRGDPVCDADDEPTVIAMTVELAGRTAEGVVPIDPAPLARVHDDECGQLAVLHRSAIGFGEPTVDGDVVRTDLVLTRTGGTEPLAVHALRGSVLIDLRPASAPAGGPLATMTADRSRAAVPVILRVIRCDPHAVIESKKTFQLGVWVAIGDGEPQRLVVTPQGPLRAALEDQIQRCLRGG